MHNWHIDAIAEHLEAIIAGDIRKLIINIPPRHMKSLAVSVFWPTWAWIKYPHLQFLFASYASNLSVRDAVRSRRIIQNPWYQERWGDSFCLTGDQNQKQRYENDKGGYRISTSVGGVGTGEGGDILILDDPHKADEVVSDTIREGDIDWWKETWSTRLNDPQAGAEVIIMQRLHEADLTGYILAEVGGYEHLCLPARYEPKRKSTTIIGWKDQREEFGELLWLERFNEEELKTLERKLGSYGAAGQLQQRPSPAEGGIFKRSWWQFYMVIPSSFDQLIQSWDCAFKDADDSDYVVGQVWGVKGADRYLLDQVRDRMDLPTTITSVKSLTAKWKKATRKLIEDKANGPAVIQMLKNKIVGLIAVNPEGGKVVRARAVEPIIEAGNVYLPNPEIAPWIHDFIEECSVFPNGANDDQVDAMTQALIELEEFGGSLVTSSSMTNREEVEGMFN